jgi:hypothetical protein
METHTASFELIWEAISELASVTGASPLNQVPGCWTFNIGAGWKLAANGHNEAHTTTEEDTEYSVLPYTVHLTFKGWPAGILTSYGITMAAGEAANADTLLAALHEAIAAQTPCNNALCELAGIHMQNCPARRRPAPATQAEEATE